MNGNGISNQGLLHRVGQIIRNVGHITRKIGHGQVRGIRNHIHTAKKSKSASAVYSLSFRVLPFLLSE
jgi:hypothetical protein